MKRGNFTINRRACQLVFQLFPSTHFVDTIKKMMKLLKYAQVNNAGIGGSKEEMEAFTASINAGVSFDR